MILIDLAIASAVNLGIELAGLIVLVALVLLVAGLGNVMDWFWPPR